MTKTLIGTDYLGVGCVKITRGTIEPVTEPDANLGSFYYNSKWSADVKINAIESTTTPASASTERVYTPSGSNSSTYTKVVANENATFARHNFDVFIKNSFFNYMPYTLPLYDIRWRRKSDGRYIEFNRIATADGDDNAGREPEYYLTFDAGRSAWYENYRETNPILSASIGSNPGNGLFYYTYRALLGGPGDSNLYDTTAIVWRLPGDNTDLLHSTPLPPVVGSTAVQVTATALKAVKPGYSINTTIPTQLAFDSSGRPLSIVYADDISIPVGTSSVNLGFATTANMLADMFPYTGTTLTFPMARERRSLQFDYWFNGNSLFFNNKESGAIRVRFMVFARDENSNSSGSGNDVMRNFTVNGENVVQLVRPGAAANPAFGDIVVDSRWPCLQILKEGWITTKTNSNRNGIGTYDDTYDVPFDDTGFFPIVKYMTFHNTTALGRHVKPPICAITRDYTDSFDYHQGRSTYCQITSGNVRFHTHNGNAEREVTNGTSWGYEFAPAQVLGIRYYILGFPRT